MEIECHYCNEINSVPRYHRGPSLICYNCATKLTIKSYRPARYKSAYSRNPFSDDDTPDYLSPPRSSRKIDFSPQPRDRIGALEYTRPFEMRDSLYPIDSECHTPRISRRYEKPTYADERKPAFRREKTDMRFDSSAHRSELRGDKPPLLPSLLKSPHESTFSKPIPTRVSTSHRPRFCSYQNLCREYVWSLNWPREYFDSHFNRCYCSQCYPASYKDVYETAGQTYVIPRGWVRFGLYVDKVKANRENLWDTWIVTYHGTKIPAARSILAHRQFLLPGDTCDDGTLIGIRLGHIPGKNQIYTSPTIKYSSLECYCERYEYSANDGKQYQAKIVLQCRQQPGNYKTQPETVGSRSTRICNFIPNDRIEILTTVRAAVVPYGLLVQLTPK